MESQGSAQKGRKRSEREDNVMMEAEIGMMWP